MSTTPDELRAEGSPGRLVTPSAVDPVLRASEYAGAIQARSVTGSVDLALLLSA